MRDRDYDVPIHGVPYPTGCFMFFRGEMGVDGQMLARIDGEPKMREDVVRPSLDRDEVLAAAPDAEEGFFKVPPVLEPV